MKNSLNFRCGRFKKIKKHTRRQGETINKEKKPLKTLFSSIFSLFMVAVLVVVAVFLGLKMDNYTTKSIKLNQNARAETLEKSTQKKKYKSMAVIETKTGRLLCGYHEKDKLPMASTTKIATAIVVIEEMGDLSQEFVVPEVAVGVEGSSMYLRRGEKLTLEEYLYGLMLPSGNDSAVALANIVSGSEEAFSVKMNNLAKRLGLNSTSFVTASGLHDDNHFTTSEDLAKLTAYAMKNKDFRRIVGEKQKTVRGSEADKPRYLKNKQKLMFDDSLKDLGIEVTGVKSGFTPEAGRCLVTSAQKDDLEVVVVLLNAPDMFVSTAEILKETFIDYEMVELLPPKKHITKIDVNGSETEFLNLYTSEGFSYPLTKEEKLSIKEIYDYPQVVSAPIKKDQIIGEVKIELNNQELFKTPILAIEKAEKKGYRNLIDKILENF